MECCIFNEQEFRFIYFKKNVDHSNQKDLLYQKMFALAHKIIFKKLGFVFMAN